jgi:hypothetical protein
MDMLFDVSPDEPTRSSSRKRPSRAQPNATEVAPEPAIYKADFTTQRAILPIGMIDHTYDCADGRCGTQCHDILHEDHGEWYLACVFCGTGQWVKAIKGHLKPREQEFVLRDGRFAGLTLAEVEKQPRGMDYLKWAAESHPRSMVKDECKRHLDKTLGTR